MTTATADIFWTSLLALNPIISWGIFPAPSCAATSKSYKAWPYALIGSLNILLFSTAVWVIHPLLVRHPNLEWIELPLQLLIIFGLNRLMILALKPWPTLSTQLPLFRLNFLALASGLLMLSQPIAGWPSALLTSIGMSLGFGLSLILVASIRERLESARSSKSLSGWPLFLLLVAVFWISCRGLLMIIK